MEEYTKVSQSPTPQLNELIKLAIGTRSLRQVEEESGISHGLLGKVINNTQKASVDLLHKLTAEEAHPQNGITYMMLMEAANYIPPHETYTERDSAREATAGDFISLREKTELNRKEFSEYLGIPYRTMTDWERGMRQAPFYVYNLIKEKVERDFNLEKKPSVRAALLMSKEETEKEGLKNGRSQSKGTKPYCL